MLEYAVKTEDFLNKNTVIYGATGTGKSSIIKAILKVLANKVWGVFVFCPTEISNGAYRAIVPPACIHYNIPADVLQSMYKRQEELTEVCKISEDLTTLRTIYRKLCAAPGANNTADERAKIAHWEQQYATIAPTEERHKAEMENLLRAFYRKKIHENVALTPLIELTDLERTAIEYMQVNPNLLIIFDDCTEILNRMKNNDTIHKIFYQGRHQHITTIFACHTDKALENSIKKGANINFFTDQRTASAYFERATNSFDKTTQRLIKDEYFRQIYNERFCALVYSRELEVYARYQIAKFTEPLQIGLPVFREFCERISCKQNTISPTNRFLTK